MIKVLMVCLGNICRSPMAECIMADMLKKEHLENYIMVSSAATSNEEEGNSMYPSAKQKLRSEGIPIIPHFARQITKQDGQIYDYIIGMEEWNVTNIKRILGNGYTCKICKLLDFTDKPKDIEDPWYTGNFNLVFDEIKAGVNGLITTLKEQINGRKNR